VAPAARKAVAEPDDETVVQTAAEAAEGVVFAHYRQSDVRDLDVTVTFEEGVLDVDVYLNAPDDEADPEAVADEAARAARDAVDELFAADDDGSSSTADD
jgi:hypothetical protein